MDNQIQVRDGNYWLNLLVAGAITAHEFVQRIDQVQQLGQHIGQQVRERYNQVQQSMNRLDRAGNQAYDALYEWTNPDPGYIQLVNEQAARERTSNVAISQSAGQPTSEEPASKKARMDAAPEPAFVSNNIAMTSATTTNNDSAVWNQRPSFPLKDRTTVLLDYYGCLSANKLRGVAETDNLLKIRMNTYKTPFAENTALVTQTAYSIPTQGLSITQSGRYATYDDAGLNCWQINQGPVVPFGAPVTNLTAEPARVDFYNNLYGAYTVRKCNWKIAMHTPFSLMTNDNAISPTTNGNMMDKRNYEPWGFWKGFAAAQYLVSGDSIATSAIPTNMNNFEMETRYKNLYDQFQYIDLKDLKTIQGTWYPGKVKHHVLNDSDIDTWTPVDTAPTSSHLEHLLVQFKESMFCTTDGLTKLCMNLFIHLQYEVQFAELADHVMFPTTSLGSSKIVTLPADLQQTAPAF